MKEIILVKYGEIILKGLNRHIFEDRLVNNIREKLGKSARVYKSLATIYVEPSEGSDISAIAEKTRKVCGVVSVTRAAVCDKQLNKISETARDYLKSTLDKAKTFKVETKRADKSYPLKSPEICAELGGDLLDAFKNLTVDVKNPDVTVNIEIREAGAYIYADKIKGCGGLPVGTGGKGLLLLSGGIDSPVAGYMMAKRGMKLEAVHFFSHPFTSESAKQKVFTLADIISEYTGELRVHVVPFTKAQLEMKAKCPAEHITLLMRRMMMMISCRIADKIGAGAVITGESLGQVASQTMEAMQVTENAADRICFRPLIGMDKEEIVKIAREIDTFDTSILPFEDCCTVFVPKHPTTKPRLERILASESALDVEALVSEAVEGTETVIFKRG